MEDEVRRGGPLLPLLRTNCETCVCLFLPRRRAIQTIFAPYHSGTAAELFSHSLRLEAPHYDRLRLPLSYIQEKLRLAEAAFPGKKPCFCSHRKKVWNNPHEFNEAQQRDLGLLSCFLSPSNLM